MTRAHLAAVWAAAMVAEFVLYLILPRRSVWVFGIGLAPPLAVAAWVSTRGGR